MVSLIHIGGKQNAGILGFMFGDLDLIEAAKEMPPVRLEFDTGTVDGYRRDGASGNPAEVRMMSYALTDLFGKFDKATRLEVVSSTASASFDLPEFPEALTRLRSCAAPS